MNAIEFTNKLNGLIGEAMRDGVDKRQMSPSDLIGCLELQKTQLIMQLVAIASAQQAAQATQNIIPANGIDFKKLRKP